MRWITRERPKIDRIACPWLIQRFIDPEAQFLYVPTDAVFRVAEQTGAIPYDISGTELSHIDELYSFDALYPARISRYRHSRRHASGAKPGNTFR